jgi:[phosphatase 2A protein]-leucine-carboxy methyltransferase
LFENVHYFEVDFQDITTKKIHLIAQNEELSKVIFDDPFKLQPDQASLQTPHYSLLHADLRQTDQAAQSLSDFGLKSDLPTFVIAECLFCYLENSTTQSIMKMLLDNLSSDLYLANFDMMHPKDAFGKMMLQNLED